MASSSAIRLALTRRAILSPATHATRSASAASAVYAAKDEGQQSFAALTALVATAVGGAGLFGWEEDKADCTAIAAVVGKKDFDARYVMPEL